MHRGLRTIISGEIADPRENAGYTLSLVLPQDGLQTAPLIFVIREREVSSYANALTTADDREHFSTTELSASSFFFVLSRCDSSVVSLLCNRAKCSFYTQFVLRCNRSCIYNNTSK